MAVLFLCVRKIVCILSALQCCGRIRGCRAHHAGDRPLLQGRRGAHGMTMKQAAAWSLVWVTLSLLFCAAFWWYLASTEGRAVADPQALAFLTGYLIEKPGG